MTSIDDGDIETMIDSKVDEIYLVKLCNEENLEMVEYLEIILDSSKQSPADLGRYLNRLKSLIMDHSKIISFRDFGVHFHHLLSLSMRECELYDLDGISCLEHLQELNVSDNYIHDLSPLSGLEDLQVLNVSGNNITDFTFTDTLLVCTQLRSLNLKRNIIEKAPNYRQIISNLLPHIRLLDGTTLDHSNAVSTTTTITTAVNAINKNIEDMFDNEDDNDNNNVVDDSHTQLMSKSVMTSTDGSNNNTIAKTSDISSYHMITEANNMLKILVEEQEDEKRLERNLFSDDDFSLQQDAYRQYSHITPPPPTTTTTTAATPKLKNNKFDYSDIDTGSELTYGDNTVLAGNAILSMRQRKSLKSYQNPATTTNMMESTTKSNIHILVDSHRPASQPYPTRTSISAQGGLPSYPSYDSYRPLSSPTILSSTTNSYSYQKVSSPTNVKRDVSNSTNAKSTNSITNNNDKRQNNLKSDSSGTRNENSSKKITESIYTKTMSQMSLLTRPVSGSSSSRPSSRQIVVPDNDTPGDHPTDLPLDNSMKSATDDDITLLSPDIMTLDNYQFGQKNNNNNNNSSSSSNNISISHSSITHSSDIRSIQNKSVNMTSSSNNIRVASQDRPSSNQIHTRSRAQLLNLPLTAIPITNTADSNNSNSSSITNVRKTSADIKKSDHSFQEDDNDHCMSMSNLSMKNDISHSSFSSNVNIHSNIQLEADRPADSILPSSNNSIRYIDIVLPQQKLKYQQRRQKYKQNASALTKVHHKETHVVNDDDDDDDENDSNSGSDTEEENLKIIQDTSRSDDSNDSELSLPIPMIPKIPMMSTTIDSSNVSTTVDTDRNNIRISPRPKTVFPSNNYMNFTGATNTNVIKMNDISQSMGFDLISSLEAINTWVDDDDDDDDEVDEGQKDNHTKKGDITKKGDMGISYNSQIQQKNSIYRKKNASYDMGTDSYNNYPPNTQFSVTNSSATIRRKSKVINSNVYDKSVDIFDDVNSEYYHHDSDKEDLDRNHSIDSDSDSDSDSDNSMMESRIFDVPSTSKPYDIHDNKILKKGSTKSSLYKKIPPRQPHTIENNIHANKSYSSSYHIPENELDDYNYGNTDEYHSEEQKKGAEDEDDDDTQNMNWEKQFLESLVEDLRKGGTSGGSSTQKGIQTKRYNHPSEILSKSRNSENDKMNGSNTHTNQRIHTPTTYESYYNHNHDMKDDNLSSCLDQSLSVSHSITPQTSSSMIESYEALNTSLSPTLSLSGGLSPLKVPLRGKSALLAARRAQRQSLQQQQPPPLPPSHKTS